VDLPFAFALFSKAPWYLVFGIECLFVRPLGWGGQESGMSRIRQVKGRKIIDSRGNPTVEVVLESGARASFGALRHVALGGVR